jgi:hypothetical protein
LRGGELDVTDEAAVRAEAFDRYADEDVCALAGRWSAAR